MAIDPGLSLLLHLRPMRDRRGDQQGFCSVCGSFTRFVRNSWVLPREVARAWPEDFVERESMFCMVCGCSQRVRRLADVLLDTYAVEATAIAALVLEPAFRRLRIAEVNGIGRMHPFLEQLPNLTYVEYPDEDLMALSFPDNSFDLVLTSDTLEHVPNPMLALREVKRVLRPTGRHVFTIPVDPRRERTLSRSGLPPQHHGRGGGPFALVPRRGDMLAETDFGDDVHRLISNLGYDVASHFEGVHVVFSARASVGATAPAVKRDRPRSQVRAGRLRSDSSTSNSRTRSSRQAPR